MAKTTKKPKIVCEKCGRKTEILKRKGYKEYLCPKCMGKVVKKEVIKHIDDLDHSFENILTFTKGSIDASHYVTNLIFYEAADITDDIRTTLQRRLKKESHRHFWGFGPSCNVMRTCGECGAHANSYKLKNINKILCLKCLSELETELTPIITLARVEAEDEYIKRLNWEFSYKYGSVGNFVERGFGSCLGPAERKLTYLAKLVVEDKIPLGLLKKISKTSYYTRKILPIVEELLEYIED